MKKLFSLILAAAMLLCAASAFAAEGRIPDSANYLFLDEKPLLDKLVAVDAEWSMNKRSDLKVAALGYLFGSSSESAAVAGNYHQWLAMQGYGDESGSYAQAMGADPFSTNMDCVGSVIVTTAAVGKAEVGKIRVMISSESNKVTMVAAAYNDEQIKGIIAEYRADALNTLICYSVISEVDGVAYIYHFNAWGGLMEVTANKLFTKDSIAIPGTDASYQYTYGYTYKDKEYLSKNDLNEQIAKDKAAGTYSVKDKVTFGILEAGPAGRNWTTKYPKLNFTRLVPSLADMVRGIGY